MRLLKEFFHSFFLSDSDPYRWHCAANFAHQRYNHNSVTVCTRNVGDIRLEEGSYE